jgi:hypothetical protein
MRLGMVVNGTVVTGTVDNTDQRTDQRNKKKPKIKILGFLIQ